MSETVHDDLHQTWIRPATTETLRPRRDHGPKVIQDHATQLDALHEVRKEQRGGPVVGLRPGRRRVGGDLAVARQ